MLHVTMNENQHEIHVVVVCCSSLPLFLLPEEISQYSSDKLSGSLYTFFVVVCK